MRIMEEMKRDLSISEQTARTKIYREIQEIRKLSEEDYTRLRKMTSKAEKILQSNRKSGWKGEDKTFKRNKCECDNKTEKRRIGEFIQRNECKRRYRRR